MSAVQTRAVATRLRAETRVIRAESFMVKPPGVARWNFRMRGEEHVVGSAWEETA